MCSRVLDRFEVPRLPAPQLRSRAQPSLPVPKRSQGHSCNVLAEAPPRETTKSFPAHGRRKPEVGSHRLCLLGRPGTATEAARRAPVALMWFEAPSEARRCLFWQARGDQGDPQVFTRQEAHGRGRAAPSARGMRCSVLFHPSLPTEEGLQPALLTSTSHRGFPYPTKMGKGILGARNPHLGCQGHVPSSRPWLRLHPLRH